MSKELTRKEFLKTMGLVVSGIVHAACTSPSRADMRATQNARIDSNNHYNTEEAILKPMAEAYELNPEGIRAGNLIRVNPFSKEDIIAFPKSFPQIEKEYIARFSESIMLKPKTFCFVNGVSQSPVVLNNRPYLIAEVLCIENTNKKQLPPLFTPLRNLQLVDLTPEIYEDITHWSTATPPVK